MDAPVTLRLGTGNARVSFSVRWFGVIVVRGSFDDVHGTVQVPGPGSQEASITIEVESHSVRTGITLRDRHLRGSRFLDSARHPVIRFESDQITRHNGVWDVRGRLSLRGHERTVSSAVVEEHATEKERRLTTRFTVPRRPHAIGTARGFRRLNPLLWAIGDAVAVQVELAVPAILLQPAVEHARVR